jgi:hypothetical protein
LRKIEICVGLPVQARVLSQTQEPAAIVEELVKLPWFVPAPVELQTWFADQRFVPAADRVEP